MYLGRIETNRRYAAALAELRARGVLGTGRLPFLHRFLIWAGFSPRPVSYLPWPQVLMLYGSAYLILASLIDWAVDLAIPALSSGNDSAALLLQAILVGGAMASFHQWRARKLGLSAWDQL